MCWFGVFCNFNHFFKAVSALKVRVSMGNDMIFRLCLPGMQIDCGIMKIAKVQPFYAHNLFLIV